MISSNSSVGAGHVGSARTDAGSKASKTVKKSMQTHPPDVNSLGAATIMSLVGIVGAGRAQ
jgi:hypothetical protein